MLKITPVLRDCVATNLMRLLSLEPLLPAGQMQAALIEVKLPLIFRVLRSAKASCIDLQFPASLLCGRSGSVWCIDCCFTCLPIMLSSISTLQVCVASTHSTSVASCLLINWLLTYLINPLNAELNPICHLLALVWTHHIVHVSGIRVNPYEEAEAHPGL